MLSRLGAVVKGFSKKNIRPLLGKPVIGYTIEAAQNEQILDRVVVSTEDQEITACAKNFGVEVIQRPPEMSTDDWTEFLRAGHQLNRTT